MGVCPSAWLNPDPHPKMIRQSILPSPVLPGWLPNQWCAHAHDRYGGNINTPSQSCWHFFVKIPYHSWWVLHMYIKRSDIMMVRRRKMLGKIIGQIFMPWWPYYMVCVQIYLIDQQKIDRSSIASVDVLLWCCKFLSLYYYPQKLWLVLASNPFLPGWGVTPSPFIHCKCPPEFSLGDWYCYDGEKGCTDVDGSVDFLRIAVVLIPPKVKISSVMNLCIPLHQIRCVRVDEQYHVALPI